MEFYDTIRQYFVSFFNNVVTFCVAVEKSNVSSNNVSCHLHAFLEFANACFADDLRDYIKLIVSDCKMDVQPCRSRKSCLKYLSNEDRNLFFNCRLSELHFNYRAYRWACSE